MLGGSDGQQCHRRRPYLGAGEAYKYSAGRCGNLAGVCNLHPDGHDRNGYPIGERGVVDHGHGLYRRGPSGINGSGAIGATGSAMPRRERRALPWLQHETIPGYLA